MMFPTEGDHNWDARIKMRMIPQEDDLGGAHDIWMRTGNLRIVFSDDYVTFHGTGLYPMPMDRDRIISLEAWIE